MDVRVNQWIQSWVMGAATVGLLSPGLLLAQSARSAATPPARRVAAPPQLLQPAPQAVRLVQHESNANGPQLAESEVEARLRELYERDGREMPNMTLTPAPSAPQGQPSSPPAALTAQPRYSPAPQIAPAPKPQSKVSGFFKKLIPGGNKKAEAQAPAQPPRQLEPAYTSPPVVSTLPPVAQPRTNVQPRPMTQPQPAAAAPYQPPQQTATSAQPVAQPTQIHAAPAPAARPIASARPAAAPTMRSPNARPIQPTPASVAPRAEPSAIPVDRSAQQAETTVGAPEISLDEEELDAESLELDDLDQPPPAASPSIASPSAGFDEEFPDPFAGASEAAPTSEPIENPYTGRTLESLDEQPASRAPVITPGPRLSRTPPSDETTATKMRRIMQRTDMKGLKGFCPVTLRDQRELADSRPEHVASYRGQKFYCASKVAQAKFEADPARYAPAAYGADVVVLTDEQDVAEGTLDYAAWYKGRLYLFNSQETHDTFVANPDRYACPPGME